VKELADRAAGLAGRITPLPPKPTQMDIIRSYTGAQLRAAQAKIIAGEIISSFVVSLVLSAALQEIISESMMLDTKIKLRGKLVEHLEKQKSTLPDLRNLLYYDIRGEMLLYGADYQPTDPTELERLMGPQEVYRAFVLSTIE
jgi:hypothetical protein